MREQTGIRPVRSYRALLAPAGDGEVAWLERHAAALDPQSPAFIVYTSGTTGHPKGALVAHGKHLAATANIVDHYPTLTRNDHRTIAYLPLCHVLGRDVAVTLPLISRLVPHFGEDPEDLATTLFEVAPTVMVAGSVTARLVATTCQLPPADRADAVSSGPVRVSRRNPSGSLVRTEGSPPRRRDCCPRATALGHQILDVS